MKQLKVVWMTVIGCLLVTHLSAQDQKQDANDDFKNWYVKPYGGFIGIQNMDLTLVQPDGTNAINVENGFGYTAGISFGYNFSNSIAAELGWEYKSNDVTVSSDAFSSKGDYASNFIYLNAIYNFSTSTRFTPYVGIGGSYIEEIDMDFGTGETAFSFQKNGQLGFQFSGGLDFAISDRWSMNWELRNTRFSNFDLTATNKTRVTDLKYNPFVINIGIKLKF